MTKKCIALIIAFVIVLVHISFNSDLSLAENEDDIEAIKALIDSPEGFNVQVRVGVGEQRSPTVVDGTTIFVISVATTEIIESYRLFYFFNGRIRRVINNVIFPYKFKQTYRGLLEGNYEIAFVLVGPQGNYGSCKMPIEVRHERRKRTKQ